MKKSTKILFVIGNFTSLLSCFFIVSYINYNVRDFKSANALVLAILLIVIGFIINLWALSEPELIKPLRNLYVSFKNFVPNKKDLEIESEEENYPQVVVSKEFWSWFSMFIGLFLITMSATIYCVIHSIEWIKPIMEWFLKFLNYDKVVKNLISAIGQILLFFPVGFSPLIIMSPILKRLRMKLKLQKL